MDVVGQGLHVGELGVGADFAASVARGGPAVVDVDVLEAVGCQPILDHGVGGGADLGVADLPGPAVPGVPAQGRRQAQLVQAADDGELSLGLAQGIAHGQLDDGRCRLAQRTADDAGGRIKRQSRRQVAGRKPQRRLARGRHEKKEGTARRRAGDVRVVDRRPGRIFAGQRRHDGPGHVRVFRPVYRRRLDRRPGRKLQPRPRPVGVTIVGVVLVAGNDHQQRQPLGAAEIGGEQCGGLVAQHRAAVRHRLAVDHDQKADLALAAGLVVDADHGDEPSGHPLQVDVHLAIGVGADAVGKRRAVDLDGMVVHGVGRLGRVPTLTDPAEVQALQPDGLGGKRIALQGSGLVRPGGRNDDAAAEDHNTDQNRPGEAALHDRTFSCQGCL